MAPRCTATQIFWAPGRSCKARVRMPGAGRVPGGVRDVAASPSHTRPCRRRAVLLALPGAGIAFRGHPRGSCRVPRCSRRTAREGNRSGGVRGQTVDRGGCRWREGRRGQSRRGSVDDQYRHRRPGRDRRAGQGARGRGQRNRARHRQQQVRRRRGPRALRAPRRPGLHRADRRRLPLQRAHPSARLPPCGGAAPQVPHQPGERGHEPPRRELPGDRADRGRERQGGADRGELGVARPAPAHADDGRERPPREHPKDAGEVLRDAIVEERDHVGPSWPRRRDSARTGSC